MTLAYVSVSVSVCVCARVHACAYVTLCVRVLCPRYGEGTATAECESAPFGLDTRRDAVQGDKPCMPRKSCACVRACLCVCV